jgi:3-oxoacyl-(acyl-carrier-protein) synthase
MKHACRIVAMDLLTALGSGPDACWRGVLRQETGVRPLRRFAHGKYACDVAAEIPSEALRGRDLDDNGNARCFRFARSVAQTALAQAPVARSRTGLVLSSVKAEIAELETAVANGPASGPGHYSAHALAGALASELNLGGPLQAVSDACASGLVAIVQAVRILERGEADAMLVVGADVLSDFVLSGFSCLGALSSQPCRPYDAARDGISLGEAAGALVLVRGGESRLPALATVEGWGLTNDAGHITRPGVTGEGLRDAVRAALRSAELEPAALGFVNGHGTGTTHNDEMEAQALYAAFGAQSPPLFSFKGSIGHTLGAAGVVETALCVKALEDQIVPASLGFRTSGLGRPVPVQATAVRSLRLDHVLTLKCGFGGINAAVILGGPERRL